MDPDKFEERMNAQDEKLSCLEGKINIIMEQVTLGRHLIFFAKVIAFLVGFAASLVELIKGLKHG